MLSLPSKTAIKLIQISRKYGILHSNPVIPITDYVIDEGYLTKKGCICIPQGSLQEFIIEELHEGGIAGYFGQHKTYSLVADRFHLPGMKKYVNKIVNRCRVCQLNKGSKTNASLYTPLHIPHVPSIYGMT